MTKPCAVVPVLVLGLSGLVSLACDSPACSPCRPGYHAVEACGACLPNQDGGAQDTSPDATDDGPLDLPKDAPAEPATEAEANLPDTTSACNSDARFFCAQGSRQGDIGICSDVAEDAICDSGQWRCPAGDIEARFCTCSGAAAPGCNVCTPQGWRCVDAGAEGADSHSETSADSSPDACDVGCSPSIQGSFCPAGEIQWDCQGSHYDGATFRAACRDAATNLQRFCCPPSFLNACR